MGDDAGRELEVAEDDVLHVAEDRLPVGVALDRLLADEVQDDREIVGAERSEGVLVLADLPQVLPVSVDDQHASELSGVDELLQLSHTGVVEEKVPRHEHETAFLRELDQLVGVLALERHRLLDEDVLPRLERLPRQGVMGDDRGCDHDRVQIGVVQELVQVGGQAGVREAHRCPGPALLVAVAEPGECRSREVVEVSGEVRPPVAEPHQADANGVGAHGPEIVSRRTWTICSDACPSP